ncbi:MAG: tetratricopeptide repeat protein [Acidobacteriota bacterium]|nr:tetratricopeptide repeat protein [Acidobacteriota bacterium]
MGILSSCSEPPAPLRPVPAPTALDTLDPPVRGAYLQRRSHLDRLLAAETEPAELAQAFGELGMWLHVYRYRNAAEAAYRNAEDLAPDELRWPFYRAHLYLLEGDQAAAGPLLEQLLEEMPEDPVLRVWLGEVRLGQGRHAEAAKLFRTALEMAPDTTRARLGAGKAALASGDAQRAVDILQPLLEAFPEASEIQHSLGLAYRNAGDLDRARQLLAEAGGGGEPLPLSHPLLEEMQALRVSAETYAARGNQALAEGRFPEAVEWLRRAAAIDPGDRDIRINLGQALLRAGRVDDGLTEYDALLQREPGIPLALFGRGLAHSLAGDNAAAIADFRAAAEADPRYLEARLNLAQLLRTEGRLEEALESYQAAIELDSTQRPARLWRTALLAQLGRRDEARRALADDLRLFPDDPELATLESRLILSNPRSTPAQRQQTLEGALAGYRAQPLLVRAETVAMAYAALGDFESAIQWQTAAAEAAAASPFPDAAVWTRERLERYRRQQPLEAPRHPRERPTNIGVRPPAGS